MEPVPKKRGRRRKIDTINNVNFDKKVQFEEHTANISNNKDGSSTQSIAFGNINIIVHKTKEEPFSIDLKKSSTKVIKCLLSVTRQELEEYNKINDYIVNSDTIMSINKNKSITVLKHFKDEFDAGKEIEKSNILCYYCCHPFENKPFFLPYDCCPKTKRYKLFGNFCSPNCVKSYAMNSSQFSSKIYYIGQFYRELFKDKNYRIKPAPSIFCLSCFGGNMTIEQFRQSFDNHVTYTMVNICAKIKPININIS